MRFLAVLLVLFASAAARADELERGQHRDLVADRTEHDFGDAAQDAERQTTITITNRGEKKVTGIFATGECGCNELTLGATELEPGASTELKVIFRTLWHAGYLVKKIRVRTADPNAGELHITQRIAIVDGLVLTPHSVTFRDVKRGDTPTETFSLRWYEGHGQPFQVTGVTVPGHAFTHTIRAYEDPADPSVKGWEVALAFGEPAVEGTLSAEVLVTTDHPDHPQLTLPLYANVSGPVWMQARTVQFGSRPAGEERATTIRFRPTDPEAQPFGEVKATARLGKVQLEVGPDPVHFDKGGYWFLKVTLPADTPPGPVEGEVVTLDVGIEGEAPIELPVKAHVRKESGDGAATGGS
ncbi:MAG: DUF1573 domain-containing protein [Planctomycetes bacterium]|nr:DUF1573 domain-containing protein [Planctomycetota bacterium]